MPTPSPQGAVWGAVRSALWGAVWGVWQVLYHPDSRISMAFSLPGPLVWSGGWAWINKRETGPSVQTVHPHSLANDRVIICCFQSPEASAPPPTPAPLTPGWSSEDSVVSPLPEGGQPRAGSSVGAAIRARPARDPGHPSAPGPLQSARRGSRPLPAACLVIPGSLPPSVPHRVRAALPSWWPWWPESWSSPRQRSMSTTS